MENKTYHWSRSEELPFFTLKHENSSLEEINACKVAKLMMEGSISYALIVDAYLLRILSPLETIDTPEGMKITPKLGLWYKGPDVSTPRLGFYRRKWPHTSGDGEICKEQYGFCEDGSPGSFYSSMGILESTWPQGKAFRYFQEEAALNDLKSQRPDLAPILKKAIPLLRSNRE